MRRAREGNWRREEKWGDMRRGREGGGKEGIYGERKRREVKREKCEEEEKRVGKGRKRGEMRRDSRGREEGRK